MKYKNDDGDYEQKMNQAAADLETETEKPQDEQYHEDCPQHDVVTSIQPAEFFPISLRVYSKSFHDARDSVLKRPGDASRATLLALLSLCV